MICRKLSANYAPTTINNYNSHNISNKRTICFGNKTRIIQKDLTELFEKYTKNEPEPLIKNLNKKKKLQCMHDLVYTKNNKKRKCNLVIEVGRNY